MTVEHMLSRTRNEKREFSSWEEQYTYAHQLCAEGVASYHAGRLEEAMHFWMQSVSVVPEFSAAIMNLGGAYKDLGNLTQAIGYFRKALEINPDFLEANFNLAVTYHLQGDLRHALDYYLNSIRIQPSYGDAHNNLDVLLYENVKDPNLARLCFQRIREFHPQIDEIGPRRIRIESSSACNLRCQHCPTGTSYSGATRSVMDLDIFNSVVLQMQAMPILKEVIFYLGGEPLLNKNLPLMCRRIKEETNATLTQFNTNGMLITEDFCRQFSDARVDRIYVSIDGVSPEENDAIRRGSVYRKLVENVHLLLRLLPDTQVIIKNTILQRPGDPENPTPPEFLLQDFPGVPVWTTYALKWPSLDTRKSALVRMGSGPSPAVDNFCKMPFTEMAVRPSGDVVMCCYDLAAEMVMGNIQQTELMHIWQSQPYKQIRMNMLAQQIPLLPDVCRKCQHFSGAIPLAPVS